MNSGNNKINLILVSEEFPPFTPGGIATYQKTLVTKLQNSGEMGDISVICKAIGDMEEGVTDENGVKVIRIKPYFKKIPFLSETIGYKAKVLITLLNERKNNRIDVIESPEWNQELFLYYVYNLITFNADENSKIALRLHTPLFLTSQLNNLKSTFRNRINIFMEKFLIDNVENVTACSQSLVEKMSELHPMKYDIQIIHNPGNDINFKIDEEYEDIYSLREKGKTNILFAGSLEYRKGIDYFCKAMKKILNENKDVNIVLSGKYGGSANANSKLSKEEVLSYFDDADKEKIRFLGLIPYESMPNVYKHVDVCIFPSIYDNYPGVVIESLLMGKAVIGSKKTGIPEAVNNGIVYIDPTDIDEMIKETQKLLNNPDLRESMGQEGYEKVLSLNEGNIKQFVTYYNRVKGKSTQQEKVTIEAKSLKFNN